MNRTLKSVVLATALTTILVGLPVTSEAQQRGGARGERGDFNPEQMRQRMAERQKEMLEIKNEDEWKVIEPRIQKVTEARREAGASQMRGMMGAFAQRGGGPGGGGEQAQGRRGLGPQSSTAVQELQKAIESKASAENLKAKIAAVREERKQKEASLEKAQEELRKVLSVRQEAIAVNAGWLD